MTGGYAVVIGGINMDVCGSPSGSFRLRDSNPGTVSVRPGGVGRNIAHNLRLLDTEVSLVSAVGGDLYSTALLENCRALGIDTGMMCVRPEMRSSVYLYVTDGTGDMCVGISDMDITACVTPEHLAGYMERINRASAVVIDANLSEETIRFLADNCTAPMYADPVSAAKAPRLKPILPMLYSIKPNRIEAEALTGECDPGRAAAALLRAGVKRVFISLGADGILAADGRESCLVPCERISSANANGAGDAATAAVVWAGMNGLSLDASAYAAVRAGAVTAGSEATNSSELCPGLLTGD